MGRAITRGTVVALGEPALVEGYRLVGAVVHAADTADLVREAWRDLPDGTVLVVLTDGAARALGTRACAPDAPLTAVIPS
jgi:vacuolar-type H+-ATPase subunit F/Vma7